MKVRAATADDIPELAAIAERSYRAAFKGILEDEVLAARRARFFAKRFQVSWQHMLVSAARSQLTGFLLMTDDHIDMLFMDPAASGQGGGALLLKAAEELGATGLECFRDNHGARRFYERHGWRVVREYRRKYAARSRDFVRYEKIPGA
ncbi:N-acetyltransferase family protein [Microvirga sp. P5_D2]